MEKLQATGRGAGGKDERLLELPIKVFKDLMWYPGITSWVIKAVNWFKQTTLAGTNSFTYI